MIRWHGRKRRAPQERHAPQNQVPQNLESGCPEPELQTVSGPRGAVLLGAIAFYTVLPVPPTWPISFQGIARWAPVVGVGLGTIVGLVDLALTQLHHSSQFQSLMLVLLLLALTGGLHLDGAMDTADGLAVMDPERRLTVMSDSRAGAFGVMVAIALIALKTLALAEIDAGRGCALAVGAGWGRWGHLWAVVQYPYLRRQGKGALHKQSVRSRWATVPSLVLLVGLCGVYALICGSWRSGGVALLGGAIALGVADYFYRRLGGHTGDTYGAVVEWTEALFWLTIALLG